MGKGYGVFDQPREGPGRLNSPLEILPLQPLHVSDLETFVDASDRDRVKQILQALPAGGLYAMAAVSEAVIGWVVVHTRFRTDLGWLPDNDSVRFQSGENAYLEHIHVKADQRGKGVGVALLGAAENHARQLGKERLWLHVAPANQGAKNFYAGQGWAAQYTVYPEWRNGEPMEVWCRCLKGFRLG